MIEKLTTLLVRFRLESFALALILLIAMGLFSKVPVIDSTLAGYNIDNNPYLASGQRINSIFGSGDLVQVMVTPLPGSGSRLLEGLQEAEDSITAKFPGTRVESLHKAAVLLRRSAGPQAPVSAFLEAALRIPLAKELVSRDTTSLLMVLFPEKEALDPRAIDAILSRSYPGIASLTAISAFHIQQQIERSILRDYALLLPLILLLIGAYLFYSYRSLRAVLYCQAQVILATLPVLFFYTLGNVSINQVTSTALPVVIILSLSASVHLLTGFVHQPPGDNRLRVQQSLRLYLLPSFLTMLTTAIAFASFVLSESNYIRQLGLVTAASLLIVFVLNYLMAPTLLPLVNHTAARASARSFSVLFGQRIIRTSRPLSLVFIALTLASVILVPRITFRTNLETFIPRGTPVFENNQAINRAFHSLAGIDVLVEANPNLLESTEISQTALLPLVRELAEHIATYPGVRSVQSIADQIDFQRQLGLPRLASVFPQRHNPFVSDDHLQYRINIRLNDSDDLWAVKQRLEDDFRPHQPKFRFELYSDFLFFHHISSRLTVSLLRSLLFSGLLILSILFLLTRSLRVTAISLLANLIPMAFLVLAFTLFGIEMNITTSITLVVCLGLIVDDTIHILYRRVIRHKPLEELAFGVVTTSVILCLGFAAFALSQSRPNQVFGLLCSGVFLLAMVSDLAITTWLLSDKG